MTTATPPGTHSDLGDPWAAIREWIGLGLVAVLVWFVASGLYSIEQIQREVEATARVAIETKGSLERHVVSANQANLALSRILSKIESRTARLEGIEEGRSDGR